MFPHQGTERENACVRTIEFFWTFIAKQTARTRERDVWSQSVQKKHPSTWRTSVLHIYIRCFFFFFDWTRYSKWSNFSYGFYVLTYFTFFLSADVWLWCCGSDGVEPRDIRNVPDRQLCFWLCCHVRHSGVWSDIRYFFFFFFVFWSDYGPPFFPVF